MSLLDKMSETKVLRDPVHGYIHVDYQIIWDCINCPEFQRLRRIRQLGASFVVYHTAEHSRFSHSLGTYEIVRRMTEENEEIAQAINEQEKVFVLLAGLLHDIGHGPFSHAFETVCPVDHETFTYRILTEDTEVHRCLEAAKKGTSKEVASIINHTHPNELLSQLISSQLDADRMDYLLRDAYFTGTKYGDFDMERILRTLRVKDHKLMVKESGIHTVEDYIMARYHMYWQVYYHPTARAFECGLTALFERLKDLRKEKSPILETITVFNAFLDKGKKVTMEDHFKMDEYACSYGFEQLMNCEDPIAADLARRLVNRDLFAYVNLEGNQERIKKQIQRNHFDPRYYLQKDEVDQRPYVPYRGNSTASIWVLLDNGKPKELSKASVIVEALVKGENRNDYKLFYPRKGLE